MTIETTCSRKKSFLDLTYSADISAFKVNNVDSFYHLFKQEINIIKEKLFCLYLVIPKYRHDIIIIMIQNE